MIYTGCSGRFSPRSEARGRGQSEGWELHVVGVPYWSTRCWAERPWKQSGIRDKGESLIKEGRVRVGIGGPWEDDREGLR